MPCWNLPTFQIYFFGTIKQWCRAFEIHIEHFLVTIIGRPYTILFDWLVTIQIRVLHVTQTGNEKCVATLRPGFLWYGNFRFYHGRWELHKMLTQDSIGFFVQKTRLENFFFFLQTGHGARRYVIYFSSCVFSCSVPDGGWQVLLHMWTSEFGCVSDPKLDGPSENMGAFG